MRQLKRKDLILEHYKLAIQAEIDGKTVRVWKPKTMGVLPAYMMAEMMDLEAMNLSGFHSERAVWATGNPDWGAWDMQTVKRMDYKKNTVDIYVCALLMRPFSIEAIKHYEERSGLDVWDRMLLMWDSRQFDEENGNDTSYGAVKEFGKDWPDYESLYRVVDKKRDIADGTIRE